MHKTKSEILEHQQHFITTIKNLSNLDEKILRKPINKGKWSIIEIVGHFSAWDNFVLHKRIPYFFKTEILPKSPSTEDINDHAAFLARTEDIEITLEKCLFIRNELLNQLNAIPDEKWATELNIGQSKLTLYEYLVGLMNHDEHHLKQIQSAISR